MIILLVALVVARTAHAVALEDLSRKQAETSEIKAKLKDEVEKTKKLEIENADLKAKRQAKLEEAKKQVVVQPAKIIASIPVSGTCSDWLAQAGVTDINNAVYLINKESGCNPNAVNRSSGACGVAQELPCGKSGCSLGDGACQVAWMQRYVFARYGSWANAVAHSQAVGWY